MPSRNPVRNQVAAIARALRPYVSSADCGPTRTALEIARNAVAVLSLEADVCPDSLVLDMLKHRLLQRWITCGDALAAARVAGQAWRHTSGNAFAGAA